MYCSIVDSLEYHTHRAHTYLSQLKSCHGRNVMVSIGLLHQSSADQVLVDYSGVEVIDTLRDVQFAERSRGQVREQKAETRS